MTKVRFYYDVEVDEDLLRKDFGMGDNKEVLKEDIIERARTLFNYDLQDRAVNVKELECEIIEEYDDEEWLNEKEKQLINIIEESKKYCKGELELDLVGDMWIAMDYREDLEGAFHIYTEGFNERIISTSEAENQGIDVRRCCDECGISYVG